MVVVPYSYPQQSASERNCWIPLRQWALVGSCFIRFFAPAPGATPHARVVQPPAAVATVAIKRGLELGSGCVYWTCLARQAPSCSVAGWPPGIWLFLEASTPGLCLSGITALSSQCLVGIQG